MTLAVRVIPPIGDSSGNSRRETSLVLDLVAEPTADIVGSAVRLRIRSQSCDVVFCFNVLEHIFEHVAALSELRRVLKPGGSFYGYVPFLVSVHADPFDYWRYTGATLAKLLTSSSFTNVSVKV